MIPVAVIVRAHPSEGGEGGQVKAPHWGGGCGSRGPVQMCNIRNAICNGGCFASGVCFSKGVEWGKWMS